MQNVYKADFYVLFWIKCCGMGVMVKQIWKPTLKTRKTWEKDDPQDICHTIFHWETTTKSTL